MAWGATAAARAPVGSPEPASAVKQSRPRHNYPLRLLVAGGYRQAMKRGPGECEGVKASLELRFFGGVPWRGGIARLVRTLKTACASRYSETH